MEHTVDHRGHPRIQTHLRVRRQAVAHVGGQPVPRVLRAGGDPAGHRHRVLREQGRPRGRPAVAAARLEGHLDAQLISAEEEKENRVIFAVRNLFVKTHTHTQFATSRK